MPRSRGFSPSQREGRNRAASGPYRSLRRCIAYTQYPTASPLRTRTGDRPSGPPPKGRVVVFRAEREFMGTEG